MTQSTEPGHTGSSAEAVEVWEAGAGAWRWRYVNRPAGVELHSNRAYESREAALAAARLAYPGVEVFERHRGFAPGSGNWSTARIGAALLAGGLVSVTVAVLASLVGLLGLVVLAVRRAGRSVRGRGVR